MAKLYATMNTRQSSTLSSKTVQNLKNDRHCTTITTRGGKETIDQPISSNEKKMKKDNYKLVKVNGEVEDNIGKDVEVPKKVTPMPRPPSLFPQ